MAVRLPAGLFLDGADAYALDPVLRRAVYETGRRNGHVPARLVELAEVVHRAAIEFREATLAVPEDRRPAPISGTRGDSSGSVSALSPVSGNDRLTARQVARLARVSEEYVRQLACRGVLRGTKSGQRGGWLLDPSSVATWMAGRGLNAA